MFVDRLINQTNVPLLQKVAAFSAQRHKLLAENIVNASTPGYRQKDLSVEDFQAKLRRRVEQRRATEVAKPGFADIQPKVEQPTEGLLFHDGNNRSMEQLMADQARNAMFHNMVVELMRKQFDSMQSALRERIA